MVTEEKASRGMCLVVMLGSSLIGWVAIIQVARHFIH